MKQSYAPVDYQKAPLKPLGKLTLRFMGEDIVVHGGPYLAKRSTRETARAVGVKMAAEIQAYCDVSIPTRDFQTPPPRKMLHGMVEALSSAIAYGSDIYVGCMAGRGRTGLFMATLAYLSGKDDPVTFVRANYYPHAVETDAQEAYAKSFDRGDFRRALVRGLLDVGAINFTRFRKMNWREKLAYFQVRFA